MRIPCTRINFSLKKLFISLLLIFGGPSLPQARAQSSRQNSTNTDDPTSTNCAARIQELRASAAQACNPAHINHARDKDWWNAYSHEAPTTHYRDALAACTKASEAVTNIARACPTL